MHPKTIQGRPNRICGPEKRYPQIPSLSHHFVVELILLRSDFTDVNGSLAPLSFLGVRSFCTMMGDHKVHSYTNSFLDEKVIRYCVQAFLHRSAMLSRPQSCRDQLGNGYKYQSQSLLFSSILEPNMKIATVAIAFAAAVSAAPAAAPEAQPFIVSYLLNNLLGGLFGGWGYPGPAAYPYPYPGWGVGGGGWYPTPVFDDGCGCFDAGNGVKILDPSQVEALQSATAAGDDAAAGAIVSAAAATAAAAAPGAGANGQPAPAAPAAEPTA